MDFDDATATEKATKWIKMKRCVGIHSSEMTSSPKRKRMGHTTSESKYCHTHAVTKAYN